MEEVIELQTTIASLQLVPIASHLQFAMALHVACASEAQARTLSLHTAGALAESHEQLPSHAAWFRDAHGSGDVLLSHKPLSLAQAQLPVHLERSAMELHVEPGALAMAIHVPAFHLQVPVQASCARSVQTRGVVAGSTGWQELRSQWQLPLQFAWASSAQLRVRSEHVPGRALP